MSNFQYPQSDRSLCRCEWSPARLGQSFSFSILSRIEASAARQRFQHVYQRDPLSVSSVGSKPLPLDKHLLYIYFIQAFSILSRIEASAAERCNYAALLTCNTFSILSRIEASAASLMNPSLEERPPFSILSRIEASAAVPALLRSTMRFLFQYPQSDRSLCRTVCSLLACRGVTTFSILSRIEASAAVPALLRSTMRFLFQYPQSDRSLCRTVCSLLACRGVTTFSILSRIEASAASLTCV